MNSMIAGVSTSQIPQLIIWRWWTIPNGGPPSSPMLWMVKRQVSASVAPTANRQSSLGPGMPNDEAARRPAPGRRCRSRIRCR